MTMSTMKEFYEVAEFDGLPEDFYRFKAVKAEKKFATNGKCYLNISMTVADGEFIGEFGPSYNLWVPEATEWAGIDEMRKRFIRNVFALTDGDITLMEPIAYSADTLTEVGEQVIGKEFWGKVQIKGEYLNTTQVYPLSKPPKGANAPAATGFDASAIDSL